MYEQTTKDIYNFEKIPAEFRETPNWVLWKREEVDGRPIKMPYRPNPKNQWWKAYVDQPGTWSSFEEVLEAFKNGKGDGLGWCVPSDEEMCYWGFDFDDAIDPVTKEFKVWRLASGELAPIQPKDILDLNTYTERTPSGAGLRAYLKCKVDVPDGKKFEYGERNPVTGKIPGIEMYSRLRFFTFSGNQLPNTPNTIEERTEAALALHQKAVSTKPVKPKKERQRKASKPRALPEKLDDEIDRLAEDLVDGHAGSRHDLLFAISGTLVGLNWERPKIDSLLKTLISCFHYEDPSYPVEETLSKHLKTLDENIERKSRHEVVPSWTALSKCLDQSTFDQLRARLIGYSADDIGNGRRLVDKNRNIIRYCIDENCWYVWDGIRWNKEDVGIFELAKGIASDIRAEANEQAGEEAQKALLRWANQSGNTTHLSAAIKCASSDPRIRCTRSEFDSHHHLLNCPNGIVDLKTGTLMDHDRKLMLSYLCPTEFHPGARHPTWDESLAAFTRKHPDFLPFLQTFTGYTFQGTKSEERIMILHGVGNSGKGTFLDWIGSTLGSDYSCSISYNSVRKQDRNSSSASGDIARLEGKRLVIVSEVEKGSRLSESFMKQVSGNDSVVARNLFKSEREFQPTHQFWLQTNFRPGFDSMDSGNQRRYIEGPFDNNLSKDPLVTFDGNIKHEMRQKPEFLQAVLAWAVTGAMDWYAHGLPVSASVVAATAALFAQNDFLSTFLEDACTKGKDESVRVKKMMEVYHLWCAEQGEDPANGRTFNRMMEERGFIRNSVREKGQPGKSWEGVSIKPEWAGRLIQSSYGSR